MEYIDIIEVQATQDRLSTTWKDIKITNNTEYGYILKVLSDTRVDLVVLTQEKVNPTFILNIHRRTREIVIEKYWDEHPKKIEFSRDFRIIINLGESLAHREKASIIYENI